MAASPQTTQGAQKPMPPDTIRNAIIGYLNRMLICHDADSEREYLDFMERYERDVQRSVGDPDCWTADQTRELAMIMDDAVETNNFAAVKSCAMIVESLPLEEATTGRCIRHAFVALSTALAATGTNPPHAVAASASGSRPQQQPPRVPDAVIFSLLDCMTTLASANMAAKRSFGTEDVFDAAFRYIIPSRTAGAAPLAVDLVFGAVALVHVLTAFCLENVELMVRKWQHVQALIDTYARACKVPAAGGARQVQDGDISQLYAQIKQFCKKTLLNIGVAVRQRGLTSPPVDPEAAARALDVMSRPATAQGRAVGGASRPSSRMSAASGGGGAIQGRLAAQRPAVVGGSDGFWAVFEFGRFGENLDVDALKWDLNRGAQVAGVKAGGTQERRT